MKEPGRWAVSVASMLIFFGLNLSRSIFIKSICNESKLVFRLHVMKRQALKRIPVLLACIAAMPVLSAHGGQKIADNIEPYTFQLAAEL